MLIFDFRRGGINYRIPGEIPETIHPVFTTHRERIRERLKEIEEKYPKQDVFVNWDFDKEKTYSVFCNTKNSKEILEIVKNCLSPL